MKLVEVLVVRAPDSTRAASEESFDRGAVAAIERVLEAAQAVTGDDGSLELLLAQWVETNQLGKGVPQRGDRRGEVPEQHGPVGEPTSASALFDDPLHEASKRLETARRHRQHPMEAVHDDELAFWRVLKNGVDVFDAYRTGEDDSLHVLPAAASDDRARNSSFTDPVDADERDRTQATALLARQDPLRPPDLLVTPREDVTGLHRIGREEAPVNQWELRPDLGSCETPGRQFFAWKRPREPHPLAPAFEPLLAE